MKSNKIEPGIFVEPSGAKHCGVMNQFELDKIWNDIGPCFGYLKPDGWRIQVHILNGKPKLFSREGKDYTKDFPTLLQRLQMALGNFNLIIDTEVVGFDRFGKHVPPERIRGASEHSIFILDGLYIDEQDITEISTLDREKKISNFLHSYLNKNLILADYKHIGSAHDLMTLYKTFLSREEEGFDGVILKAFRKSYFTTAIKVKKEITVDPVVIGAYLSHQDRISSILIAVFDNQTNLWVPIGKVSGQGVEWDKVCNVCLSLVEPEGLMNVVNPPEIPDRWINPKTVVQITARSISQGANGSYILRVDAPREVFVREDKSLKTSTSFEQLLEMGGFKTRPPMPLSLFGQNSKDSLS